MIKSFKKNREFWFLIIMLILGLVLISFVFILTIQKKAPLPPPLSPTKVKQFLPSGDFEEIVSQLDTPQKLIDSLNENFILEEGENDFSLSPEEFFTIKKGKRNDFATFLTFVLTKNGYFSSIFRYKFIDQNQKERIQTLVIFRDKNEPKAIDFEDSKLKIFPGGNSPIELCEFLEKKHQIQIKEIAAFNSGSTDLSRPAWLPR